MFDLSDTVIEYLPALSVFTLTVPFFRVMVNPGPTVPLSFVGPIAPLGAASASIATSPAAKSAIRDIFLL